jgi:alpha-tubulin suppressor-like RCC1 family protein
MQAATPVPVSKLTQATAIAAGGEHSCAVVSDGRVMCWGSNFYGELGTGMPTSDPAKEPVEVLGVTTATAVAVGRGFSCALVDDGKVVCWGSNGNGCLGNGGQQNSATPVSVAGDFRAKSLSVGTDHACVVTSDAGVKCWGSNSNSKLGTTLAQTNIPVDVEELADVKAVSAGYSHTCAVKEDGVVVCWGGNGGQQLGNGTTTDSVKPVLVAGSGLGNAESVAAGFSLTCALLEDRTQRCWGR